MTGSSECERFHPISPLSRPTPPGGPSPFPLSPSPPPRRLAEALGTGLCRPQGRSSGPRGVCGLGPGDSLPHTRMTVPQGHPRCLTSPDPYSSPRCHPSALRRQLVGCLVTPVPGTLMPVPPPRLSRAPDLVTGSEQQNVAQVRGLHFCDRETWMVPLVLLADSLPTRCL